MKKLVIFSILAAFLMAAAPVYAAPDLDSGQSSELVVMNDPFSEDGNIVVNPLALIAGEAVSSGDGYELVELKQKPIYNQASIFGILGGGKDEGGGTEPTDIINIVLLVVTSVFGRLWVKLKGKLSELTGLLAAFEDYMKDDRISSDESKDIVRRVNRLLGKDPAKNGD